MKPYVARVATPILAVAALGLGLRAYSGTGQAKAQVLFFISTDCPVSASYTPRINALYKQFAPQDVSFRAVFSNDLETRSSVQHYMADRGYSFPFKLDLGAPEAKRLGVNALPSAVVLDGSGREIYRGAIDDNPDPAQVTDHYAADAVEAVLAGKSPATRETPAFGCVLMPSATPPSSGEVTYAKYVKPILQQHCVQCHQPGEVAPFSLETYPEARKWAPMIDRVIESGQMPPWKAVHGYGDFRGDNSLTETQIETLHRWNEAGAPKGDLGPERETVAHAKEWRLGKPDLIETLPKPFRVAADGTDEYRNYVFKTNFSKPMYVSGMDVKPGNPLIVHHVVVFVDTSGRAEKLCRTESDGQEGYEGSGAGPGFFPDTSFGGWVPGAVPGHTPAGTAFLLKPGADIVVQVHYHKNGKPETDQTKLGLYFSKTAPKHVLQLTWLVNPFIDIPAGDSHHKEQLTYTARQDMTVYAVMPHMHWLGHSMKADVTFPDGSTQPLVFVDNWDFNWQLTYRLQTPLHLPKGSKVHVEAVYDNSTDNPRNPNKPPAEVKWGEQTTDEMFVLVLADSID